MFTWIFLHIPIYLGASQAQCDEDRAKTFLGIFPTWYKYVNTYTPSDSSPDKSCGFGTIEPGTFSVQLGLAIIDILLRAGALAAVIFIIIGGYKYISSQGEPKNIEAALATIVNAVIGLAIVLLATVLVAFIGNSLGG